MMISSSSSKQTNLTPHAPSISSATETGSSRVRLSEIDRLGAERLRALLSTIVPIRFIPMLNNSDNKYLAAETVNVTLYEMLHLFQSEGFDANITGGAARNIASGQALPLGSDIDCSFTAPGDMSTYYCQHKLETNLFPKFLTDKLRSNKQRPSVDNATTSSEENTRKLTGKHQNSYHISSGSPGSNNSYVQIAIKGKVDVDLTFRESRLKTDMPHFGKHDYWIKLPQLPKTDDLASIDLSDVEVIGCEVPAKQALAYQTNAYLERGNLKLANLNINMLKKVAQLSVQKWAVQPALQKALIKLLTKHLDTEDSSQQVTLFVKRLKKHFSTEQYRGLFYAGFAQTMLDVSLHMMDSPAKQLLLAKLASTVSPKAQNNDQIHAAETNTPLLAFYEQLKNNINPNHLRNVLRTIATTPSILREGFSIEAREISPSKISGLPKTIKQYYLKEHDNVLLKFSHADIKSAKCLSASELTGAAFCNIFKMDDLKPIIALDTLGHETAQSFEALSTAAKKVSMGLESKAIYIEELQTLYKPTQDLHDLVTEFKQLKWFISTIEKTNHDNSLAKTQELKNYLDSSLGEKLRNAQLRRTCRTHAEQLQAQFDLGCDVAFETRVKTFYKNLKRKVNGLRTESSARKRTTQTRIDNTYKAIEQNVHSNIARISKIFPDLAHFANALSDQNLNSFALRLKHFLGTNDSWLVANHSTWPKTISDAKEEHKNAPSLIDLKAKFEHHLEDYQEQLRQLSTRIEENPHLTDVDLIDIDKALTRIEQDANKTTNTMQKADLPTLMDISASKAIHKAESNIETARTIAKLGQLDDPYKQLKQKISQAKKKISLNEKAFITQRLTALVTKFEEIDFENVFRRAKLEYLETGDPNKLEKLFLTLGKQKDQLTTNYDMITCTELYDVINLGEKADTLREELKNLSRYCLPSTDAAEANKAASDLGTISTAAKYYLLKQYNADNKQNLSSFRKSMTEYWRTIQGSIKQCEDVINKLTCGLGAKDYIDYYKTFRTTAHVVKFPGFKTLLKRDNILSRIDDPQDETILQTLSNKFLKNIIALNSVSTHPELANTLLDMYIHKGASFTLEKQSGLSVKLVQNAIDNLFESLINEEPNQVSIGELQAVKRLGTANSPYLPQLNEVNLNIFKNGIRILELDDKLLVYHIAGLVDNILAHGSALEIVQKRKIINKNKLLDTRKKIMHSDLNSIDLTTLVQYANDLTECYEGGKKIAQYNSETIHYALLAKSIHQVVINLFRNEGCLNKLIQPNATLTENDD